MDSFNDTLQSPQFDQISIEHLYQHISEGLFAHFFSVLPYSKEDILCFMSLANKEVPWENCLWEMPTKATEDNCSCFNLSNLKFTLDKILCKGEKDSDEDIAKPLKFYKAKVQVYVYNYVLVFYVLINILMTKIKKKDNLYIPMLTAH